MAELYSAQDAVLKKYIGAYLRLHKAGLLENVLAPIGRGAGERLRLHLHLHWCETGSKNSPCCNLRYIAFGAMMLVAYLSGQSKRRISASSPDFFRFTLKVRMTSDLASAWKVTFTLASVESLPL